MKRSEQTLYFGAFRLNTAERELFCGDEKIHLRPKTYAVLQFLAERPGRTVTKDELSAGVWPQAGGDDDAIRHCVREIRAKLGDDKNNPKIVETRPQIGYRFVADVKSRRLPFPIGAFTSPAPDTVWGGLEKESDSLSLPADLESLHEAYYYALKARCFDEAGHIFLYRRLGESLFLSGYYAMADELLNPLIQAHLNGSWKTASQPLALLYTLSGMIAAKSYGTKQAAILFQKATNASEPGQSFIPAGYLSEVVVESGSFFEALDVLERARVLEEQAGVKESYRIIGRRGYINAAVGQVRDAMCQLSQAIVMSRDEDPSYACLYLRVRADLNMQAGRQDEAQSDYSQALELALDHHYRDYEGHILRGQGDLSRFRRDLPRSSENYGAALAIAENTGYLWLEAEARIGLAHLAIDQGEFGEAGAQADAALKMAASGGWLVQEIQAHLAHAKISARRGLMIEARSHREVASSLAERSGHYWSRQKLN